MKLDVAITFIDSFVKSSKSSLNHEAWATIKSTIEERGLGLHTTSGVTAQADKPLLSQTLPSRPEDKVEGDSLQRRSEQRFVTP